MGDAAVKEPSMEDILSSIRKIIAEEGATETVAEPSAQMQSPVQTETYQEHSEIEATPAEAAQPYVAPGSHEAPHIEPEAAFVEEPLAVEPVVEAPMVAPQPTVEAVQSPAQAETSMSLASIAASLRSSPEPEVAVASDGIAPVEQEPPMPAETFETRSVEETFVEMSEATPPPAPQTFEEPMNAVPVPTASDMAREEEAFRGALMSPSADDAVIGSFDRLKRSAMDDLDAKTEAILRPMLREWLDENLPSMVERLVREEIERVARG